MLVPRLLSRAGSATSTTHDVTCLAKLLARSHLTASSTVVRSSRAAYPLAVQKSNELSRSYATATATKSKTTAKKTTKPKTAAKKSASKSTAKSAPKKKRATSAKAKKKTTVKKTVVRRRKPLSEKAQAKKALEKQRDELKATKERALLTEPKRKPETAFLVMMAGKTASGTGSITNLAKETSEEYKNLSVADRERYNHEANQNKIANQDAYKKWVLSHTPDQIRTANVARRNLKKLAKTKGVKNPGIVLIQDDRSIKRPRGPNVFFFQERFGSGDFAGIPVADSLKRITEEYLQLPADEKKKYVDLAAADRQRYTREYTQTYGHSPTTLSAKKTKA